MDTVPGGIRLSGGRRRTAPEERVSAALPKRRAGRAANRDYSPWSLLPGSGAFGNTERAWYEFMGLVWERMRGR